jgi:hypothetical protein
MAAFIMLSAVLLGFAVIGELVFLGYDFATLIKVFSALPMVQKIVLLVICLARSLFLLWLSSSIADCVAWRPDSRRGCKA